MMAGHSGATSIPGYPERVEAYDPREVARLPKYCMYTLEFRRNVPGGNNGAEIKRWSSLMGPTFNAMHHYCWGLMHTNRAIFLAPTKQLRNFHLSASINEFDYVLRRASDDFVLLPEILTKKGENLIRLGRGPLAVGELERAIAVKPDYWPPYVVLSDYFRDSGDIGKAREVIERGLAAAPDTQALKKRLAELQKSKAKAGDPARTEKKSN
jgi:tetratricopeptide (TPR) repeat protein